MEEETPHHAGVHCGTCRWYKYNNDVGYHWSTRFRVKSGICQFPFKDWLLRNQRVKAMKTACCRYEVDL
jgi:hypothetical protein